MTTAAPAAAKPARRKRIVPIVIVVVLVIALIAYMVVARIAYDTMSLVEVRPELLPQIAYEEVSFPSRGREYPVYAFWQTSAPNAPAIINVHGYGGSRYFSFIQDRAAMLVDMGYNVLTPDLSDNSGETIEDGRISMGYDERYDVLGAYDYLLSQGFTSDRIGLVGESMGAATSLLAAGLEPAIKVIWADSPFSDAPMVLTEQASAVGVPAFVLPGLLLWGQLLANDHIAEASPIAVADSLAENNQAVYLSTCTTDAVVNPHHARDLYPAFQAAGVDVQLWEIPCDSHATGILYAPDEYRQRMGEFLSRLQGAVQPQTTSGQS